MSEPPFADGSFLTGRNDEAIVLQVLTRVGVTLLSFRPSSIMSGLKLRDDSIVARNNTVVRVADGQILEREQTHGTVQGAELDGGADQNVVPKPSDQVEEAAGVQAEDRPSARLLPTGAALRVVVRAPLLLPGGSGRRRRRWSAELRRRLRVAGRGADFVRRLAGPVQDSRGARRTGGRQDGAAPTIIIKLFKISSCPIRVRSYLYDTRWLKGVVSG